MQYIRDYAEVFGLECIDVLESWSSASESTESSQSNTFASSGQQVKGLIAFDSDCDILSGGVDSCIFVAIDFVLYLLNSWGVYI